jgi:hypothetical protein
VSPIWCVVSMALSPFPARQWVDLPKRPPAPAGLVVISVPSDMQSNRALLESLVMACSPLLWALPLRAFPCVCWLEGKSPCGVPLHMWLGWCACCVQGVVAYDKWLGWCACCVQGVVAYDKELLIRGALLQVCIAFPALTLPLSLPPHSLPSRSLCPFPHIPTARPRTFSTAQRPVL